MGVLDAIRTGLSELLSHKMRSALTMLGVIFGVAAVIAMVSIGEGAKQEALDQIKRMGIDVVHVKRAPIAGELLEKSQSKQMIEKIDQRRKDEQEKELERKAQRVSDVLAQRMKSVL